MSDNFGVLGSVNGTTQATHTAYICPAGKAAKVKLMGKWRASGASVLSILVNEVVVAITAAMAANNYTFTNGGAGLLRAPGATDANGQTAAETVQPAPPIYYLSAGQAIRYTVGGADLLAGSGLQVVGVEIDLTP